jgi:hypothetical protein
MNKSVIIVVIFLSLLSFVSQINAQTHHNHAQCGVSIDEGIAIKSRMLENRRNKAELLAQAANSRSNDSTVFVPLQFHIVNKSDGTGGETITDILSNLCRLNDDYLHLNIEFYLAGPVRTINQDYLYNNDWSTGLADYFMGLYKIDGVVNIFVGNQIISGQTGGTTLGYYTSGLDIIYAIRGSVNGNATTLTHELGHFFSLPHTFFGWENSNYATVMAGTNGRTPSFTLSGWPVENIARGGGNDNCTVAADGFCDTEPNYLFGFFGGTYNNGCDYAATAHDPQGYLFRPEMIAQTATSFKLLEDNSNLTELFLKNNSTKDKLYPKTKVVIETQYTLGSNTITMWQDTIGDSDTTDFFVAANTSNDIISASLQNSLDVKYEFINMGNHYLDINVSAPTAPSLSFNAAQATYTITGVAHDISMDSLRVNNTSSTATVASNTNVIINDIFTDGTTQISSDNRSFSLPVALAPGESYTFSAADLQANSTGLTSIAGVTFNTNTFVPLRDTTGTTSENVMSYYSDACATLFSPQQGDAIKLDIISRAFETLYPEPSNIDITDISTVNTPADSAIAPNPLVHFTWNSVNGATMYFVRIYEINFLGLPISGGDDQEFITTDTDVWRTLVPNKVYAWEVKPINSTFFCDNSYTSEKTVFWVYDWTVNTEKVLSGIENSKIYPNPSSSKERVMLEITASINGKAEVSIFNGIGQVVMPEFNLELNKGNNLHQINTSALNPGLYVVNIKTMNRTISHKLVIKD